MQYRTATSAVWIEDLPDYHWSADSAIWQVTYGNPDRRTTSALEFLQDVVAETDDLDLLRRVARELADNLFNLK
ncbi:MAG: hypothetical protein ACREHG_07415 [Candidatus Saccharimonadales bacterium]